MAKHRKKNQGVSLPGVDEVEKFLDKLTYTAEDLGNTIVSWLQGIIGWLRKHKKLAIAIVALAIVIHWANSRPRDNDDEEE